ncbi:DnaD domain-containing protein [Enterococcus cecorum]|uniref:DnaD domain-containing protein n=1 Tax=Enterococcus cecorum TaxID=44008 RepID=UPI0032665023
MSDRGGWIVLHRKLLDKPIWFESTAEQKVILITLLLMANHAEKEWEWQGQKYVAKPGQFVTSLSKIAEVCGEGISFQNVRTALKRFEKYGFLTNESTNKNRLITINNWAFYQDNPNDTNRHPNKQLTSNQQATNKQLTTNNNDKQINNVTNNVVVNEQVDPISKAIRTYEQVFGLANPITIQTIQFWCQDLSPELVIKALEITSSNNARSFKYTEAILRSWEKQGIQTIEDVDALEKQREVQQQEKPKPKFYGNRRIEEVPDHFKNPPQETHNPESVESAKNALNQLLGGSSVGN